MTYVVRTPDDDVEMSDKEDEENVEYTQPKLNSYSCNNNTFVVPERYEITGIVGKGAYGIVASAQDKFEDHKIAIKKIFNIFDHDGEYQKRILRELLILDHFRGHENIVCLTDVGPPKSYGDFTDVYIMTEFMDTDLRAIIKSKQVLSEVNVQYFLYQILRGLKYIHSANVLHRDIKPSNILLNQEMDLKLCDFGLSRGVDFEKDPTMSTSYVATRWYRAPELLLMWDKTSKSIDIWSVGCIFAELLDSPDPRRKVLFPGKHYLDQLDKIIAFCGTPKKDEIRGCAKAKKYLKQLPRKKKVNLKERFPDASDDARDLLAAMLTFDPLKRITVEEALKHPYLEKMHDPEDEPNCSAFNFRSKKFKNVQTKKLMFDFIMDWNKKVHKYKGDSIIDENIVEVKKK